MGALEIIGKLPNFATPVITKIPCYLAEKLGTKNRGSAARKFVHASRNF
jgi:hypothetical protein